VFTAGRQQTLPIIRIAYFEAHGRTPEIDITLGAWLVVEICTWGVQEYSLFI